VESPSRVERGKESHLEPSIATGKGRSKVSTGSAEPPGPRLADEKNWKGNGKAELVKTRGPGLGADRGLSCDPGTKKKRQSEKAKT